MTWPSNPYSAITAVQVISGLALALSSLEFLCLWREFSSDRVFSALNLPVTLFRVLMLFRFLLALLIASCVVSGYWLAAVLATLSLLVLVTNRLLVFGLEAADQMLSVVLVAQLLAALAPGNVAVQKSCLWFIALQTALAYAVAGWSKWMKPAWRNGSYVIALLQTEIFGHPGFLRVLSKGMRARRTSLLLIAIECCFPLALLLGWRGAVFFVGSMLFMHVVNGFMLGLNLFILAFLCTYPAVLYCAASLYR